MNFNNFIILITLFNLNECSKTDNTSKTSKDLVLNETLAYESKIDLLKVEELPGSVREIYHGWDKFTNESKKKLFDEIFEKDSYWGYFFSAWGRYAFYTENPKVFRIFQESLRFVKQEYSMNGVILTKREVEEGHWYRETYARNMRLLLEAYTFTNDLGIIEFIDDQTDIWIKTNTKANVNGYSIYPYSSKLQNARSTEINPNQNLQMGLVFSKLYFTQQSKYYLDDAIKESAINEINAGLSLVQKDGFFPLNQFAIKVGDSNYAGLSTTILYELVQIWGNSEWIDTLQKVGLWLEASFNENRPWNTKADGQDYHFDQFSAFNLFSRIPSFYAAGISSERSKEWMSFVQNQFKDFQILGLFPRWAILQSLPESYYSNEDRGKKLKEINSQVYVWKQKKSITINVVGSEIISLQIGNYRTNEVKDFVIKNLTIAEGEEIIIIDRQNNKTVFTFKNPLAGNNMKVIFNIFDYRNPVFEK